MRTGSKSGQITPADGDAFLTSAINAMTAPASAGASAAEEVAPFAAFEQGIAQIAGGDEPRWQSRDFALLLFNDFVEDVHWEMTND